jgi:hypothetical protein
MFKLGDAVKLKVGVIEYSTNMGHIIKIGMWPFHSGMVKVCVDFSSPTYHSHWIPENAVVKVEEKL